MRKYIVAWVFFTLFTIKPIYAVDFAINDPVISGLEISVVASLSASSNYYLQAVLRAQSSTKYFGETQNHRGDWVDYVSSPDKELITSNFFLTDIRDASWSGSLRVRFKNDDPNYLGPGLYDLKLRRFTGNSSSSAGESNTLVVTLNASLPIVSPTPSPSPTSTPNPSPSPSPYPSPTPSPIPSPSPKLPTPVPLNPVGEGSVAGVVDISFEGYGISPTPAPSPLKANSPTSHTLNRTRLKIVLLIGTGLILLSVSLYLGYYKFRYTKNKIF